MAKIRTRDLARMMRLEYEDLIFKIKSIGVPIEGDEALIDPDIIKAILQGRRLPEPRQIILRDAGQNESTDKLLRHNVFISYNSQDRKVALDLHDWLRRQGLFPWIDVRDAIPGRPWLEQLDQVIGEIPSVLVLIGPSGLGPWEIEETAATLRQAVERQIPVIPVFLEGTPPAINPKSLPLFLGTRVCVDLREESLDRLVQGVRSPSTTEPPQPSFRSQETKRLSVQLEDLYRQREELTIAGNDTRALDSKILDTRRLLRKGPQLQAGEFLLNGRFRLVRPLGQGGFATVWKAYDRELRRLVAVKVLHGQHSEDRSRTERFFRGARRMAELVHPNIVRVLEEDLEDDGWLFFVMELVPEGDLSRCILHNSISYDKKLVILCEVGDALEFAHRKGVVHRDVKPTNILLDEAFRPKLTDFDLVRADDSTGFTQTRAMLGTLNYAAPEALDTPKTAGPTADVYSLASTAVFALLGKPLPRGYYRNPSSTISELNCSLALAQVLNQATASDPESRFSSAGAFVEALERAIASNSHSQENREEIELTTGGGIYVGNLPYTVTEVEIRDLFETFGRVTSVTLISDRATGRPRGFGFVDMKNGRDEAVAALDGHWLRGRRLKVNEARPRRRW